MKAGVVFVDLTAADDTVMAPRGFICKTIAISPEQNHDEPFHWSLRNCSFTPTNVTRSAVYERRFN